ncbi:MAG: hypothetical protein M1833_003673 [Piccolia ochrophora]|nr:MAG: hypothetical protein M1833_003673 [Piccolia ochrophora]
MQSVLQYRQFERHIRQQYERDREKTIALAQQSSASTHASLNSSSPSATSSSVPSRPRHPIEDDAGAHDAEKAEASPAFARLDPQVSNADAELEGHKTPPPEPLETETTGRTLDTLGTNLGVALTGVDVRTRSRQQGKIFVVGFEGEKDPLNPHNWSKLIRARATILIAFIGFVVGIASSIDSAALPQAAEDFGVSEIVESLATGLFLAGFGFGALFAGPVSETVGRNPVYLATLTIYMIWIMASALAPNIGAQLTFRFLAGFFGATPLVCAGGSISDLWSPMERTYAFPVFANAAFSGPVLGPVIGGFIGQSSIVGWRWTEWITLIMSGLTLGLVILFQPETYPPILLKWKATHLRQLTGDDRYKAEVEIREERFLTRLRRALYRPFLLTAREPIIILLALYLTVIYIILFAFLNGYTFIFSETYGFSQGLTGLCFLTIAVGLCLCTLLVPVIYSRAKRKMAAIRAEGGTQLPPEFRLWFAMLGAPTIPISLLWMGWTARESVSPWSPLAASVLFGFGILTIFISSYQYIIDVYETFSASALASLTLIRYVAAGAMVVVALPMYGNLGVPWTLTVLAGISALLVPVPYAFYKWGTTIRGWSKYAQG